MNYVRLQDARVLVVDDDEAMLSFLLALFSLCGTRSLQCATSGDAAMQLLSAGGSFDLVITDIYMPPLDGLQLVARARTQGLQVPFLVVTAFPAPDIQRCVAGMPRTALVAKPFAPRELLTTAEQLLAAT